MPESPAPDDRRLFLLLRQLGLDDEQACTFVQELQTMAAVNLSAQSMSKPDAQNTKLDVRDSNCAC